MYMFYVIYVSLACTTNKQDRRAPHTRAVFIILFFSNSVVDHTGCTHKGSYKVTMDDEVDACSEHTDICNGYISNGCDVLRIALYNGHVIFHLPYKPSLFISTTFCSEFMYLWRLYYGSHSHLRVRKINEHRQILTICVTVVRLQKT